MNCPMCSGVMLPLFTGFFCPKDCDKAPTKKVGFRTFQLNGKQFRASVLHKGDKIPNWSTHGYWVHESETIDTIDPGRQVLWAWEILTADGKLDPASPNIAGWVTDDCVITTSSAALFVAGPV